MDRLTTMALARRRLIGGASGLAGAVMLPLTRWAAMATAQHDDGIPNAGGVLNIGQDVVPKDLDPTRTTAWASTNVEELIYTGLLRWTPDMKVAPDLAVSFDKLDDLTYVFKLREGVTFHNGATFSAGDVKYTFERILDPATASPHSSIYRAINAVEVVNPLTVKFTLSEPFAPLLRYLATIPYGAIVPWGAGDELASQPIGTGPFAFAKREFDQQITLKRHDGYYEEGQPYLDEVVFKILGENACTPSAPCSEIVWVAWLKERDVAQSVA